jgi:benzoylsuccinyl-CoA thiolase BbsB subunit
MVKFGKYPEKTVSEIGREAVIGLLKEMNLNREAVDAVYVASVRSGSLIGQRILKEIGMTGIPIYNVENACSSGGTAFHEAWLSVAAGVYDVVMVVGVEKLSNLGGGTLPLDFEDIEVNHGIVMPAVYAMRARRYMHEYGATAEDLALVSVKNHYNGSLNPFAQYQNEVTLDEVMNARMIADPFTLLHCCPNGDGAAAVLICPTDMAKEFGTPKIDVKASVVTSGYFKGGYRDLIWPDITYRAAKEAYQMSGLSPKDIDVAEVHDAFTIAEILYYEVLGFCEKGEGYRYLREGKSALDGEVAFNPSGGLMSKGHPLGASGVAQIVEIYWQLTGQAGKRQVRDACVGLTHVTGGGISGVDNGACSVHLFTV